VVARLDRLARDLVLQETLIAECRKHGARVWSTAAGEDAYLEEIPDDPSRKMIRQILGAVAEYERGMIALRMAAGKARKVAEGGYAHGAPPYGWDAVDGRLEINELEQTQLAIMRTMRQGNASYRTICRVLNASGSRAKKGGPWHSNVVRRILDLDAARREETTTS
jgi:DNA invertase Pin-like site-specific DNA recombinase